VTTLAFTPAPGVAPHRRQLRAQARMELVLLLRNAEQLLLTVAIPTFLLVLLSKVTVLNVPAPSVDFVVPGVLALAVLSTAFTGQAIATGFERRYGVLRRLALTPLPRSSFVAAKTVAVLAVEVVQIGLLCLVGVALGWSPHGDPAPVVGLLLLGTVAMSALGLLLAGTLRAEATLGLANLLYLVMLGLGGVMFPVGEFSTGLRHVVGLLPLNALADGLRAVLRGSSAVPLHDWVTLLVWGLAGAAVAARAFKWE
jgi:ABC-2 type transport system permease protein